MYMRNLTRTENLGLYVKDRISTVHEVVQCYASHTEIQPGYLGSYYLSRNASSSFLTEKRKKHLVY